MSDKLCVVMPVYNEQEAIAGVLEKWNAALKALDIDYEIRPYNDGSRDRSLEVMRETAARLGNRICVKDKPNGGHGNTILTGYREAAADGFDWIFQIDSDDEMGPEKFGELWKRRNDYDFLVGIRDGRVQALPRKVISFVSRCCVKTFYGRKTIWDVNTPYRLMRATAFKDVYEHIPLTTFAPNVVISGMVARKKLRFFEVRVPQHDRTTGEVSIKKFKLFKAAVRSFLETIDIALNSAPVKSFVVIAGLTFLAKLLIAYAVGMKFDVESFILTAKALLSGVSPYLSGRYNYGPLWMYVIAPIYKMSPNLFPILIAGVIAFCDCLMAWMLYAKKHKRASLLFLLSPIVIIVSGGSRMFDNIAIMIALAGVLFFGSERKHADWLRVSMLCLLIAFSITMKHICAFLPLWLFFRERDWGKRFAVVIIPMFVFMLSFVPHLIGDVLNVGLSTAMQQVGELITMPTSDLRVFDPTSSSTPILAGIVKNVFMHRPFEHPVFWMDIAPAFLLKMCSPFVLFVVSMILMGYVARKLRPLQNFALYLASLTVLACGHFPYYWALPALFVTMCSLPSWMLYNIVALCAFRFSAKLGVTDKSLSLDFTVIVLVICMLNMFKTEPSRK